MAFQNVKTTIEGDFLVLRIDLRARAGATASGNAAVARGTGWTAIDTPIGKIKMPQFTMVLAGSKNSGESRAWNRMSAGEQDEQDRMAAQSERYENMRNEY